MFKLFDLFSNPENLKSWKCQACFSSSRRGSWDGWFDVLYTFWSFFLFVLIGYTHYLQPPPSHPPLPLQHSLIKERLASKGERASNFHELKREPSVSTDLGESWTVIVQKGQTALLPNIHTHTHTHTHTQTHTAENQGKCSGAWWYSSW